MKAYSVDLRQRIVDTYLEGGISQHKLAKRFKVALSFVQKILKQYRETGNVSPKVRIEQTPPKLNEQQLKVLEEIVEANNDKTLAEIRILLEQKTGVLIGRSTVDRMLKKMDIRVKKKHYTPRKKKLKESKI